MPIPFYWRSLASGSLGNSMNPHNPNKLALCLPRAVLAALGLSCFLTANSGCKTADKKDDPLLGVKPPQVNPVPPTTGANPGSQSRAGVPPIPGATSGGSTAALASLPNGRPLAINNGQPSPAPQNVSTAPTVQPIPREAPPTPGLLTTGAWGQQTPAITPNLPSSTGDHSTDGAFAPLQARGASAHFVEAIPEGVHLRVLVPNRGDAGARVYEARARDTATAVQAVVQQIDQQRN
jgi:hypothetical protein